MGFTEQGEGLLQDRPAGTGTWKLSGVAPPRPLPLSGRVSFLHSTPGKGSLVRKLWPGRGAGACGMRENLPVEHSGRTQPHQRGGVCDRPSTPVN